MKISTPSDRHRQDYVFEHRPADLLESTIVLIKMKRFRKDPELTSQFAHVGYQPSTRQNIGVVLYVV